MTFQLDLEGLSGKCGEDFREEGTARPGRHETLDLERSVKYLDGNRLQGLEDKW